MSNDDLPPDRSQNGYLAAKLARLERLLEEQAHMLAEQSARLRAVEQRVGVEPPARPFGQGRAPEPEAQREQTMLPPWPVDEETKQSAGTTAPPSVTADTGDRARKNLTTKLHETAGSKSRVLLRRLRVVSCGFVVHAFTLSDCIRLT